MRALSPPVGRGRALFSEFDEPAFTRPAAAPYFKIAFTVCGRSKIESGSGS
jgi:hypothetical protein